VRRPRRRRWAAGAGLAALALLALILAACGQGGGQAASGASEGAGEAAGRLPEEEEAPAASPEPQELLECLYYEENGFFKADAAEAYDAGGELRAATSPHFLPCMDYTAGVLKTVAAQGGCDTVFVVAPNHSGQGFPVTLSPLSWNTPFGVLETDREAVAAILGDSSLRGLAGEDAGRLEADHSASVQTPFIKCYLPDAKVVALLVGKGAAPETLDRLAEHIRGLGEDRRVFLLCSVDFSHYEPIEKVAGHDAETEAALLAGDAEALLAFGNEHMDSPQALRVFLRYGAALAEGAPRKLDGRVLPESEMSRAVGYSYYVYGWVG
jgi:AmmeMemoRadiSam system protein B